MATGISCTTVLLAPPYMQALPCTTLQYKPCATLLVRPCTTLQYNTVLPCRYTPVPPCSTNPVLPCRYTPVPPCSTTLCYPAGTLLYHHAVQHLCYPAGTPLYHPAVQPCATLPAPTQQVSNFFTLSDTVATLSLQNLLIINLCAKLSVGGGAGVSPSNTVIRPLTLLCMCKPRITLGTLQNPRHASEP